MPDVALLEISMPVLDGFGLAAALLEANERTRELPLIFLTTEDDPLIKAKAFETGAHAVITKPFEPHAVTSFIERVVAQVVPRRRLSVVDPVALTEEEQQGVGRRVVVGQHRHVLRRDGCIDAV